MERTEVSLSLRCRIQLSARRRRSDYSWLSKMYSCNVSSSQVRASTALPGHYILPFSYLFSICYVFQRFYNQNEVQLNGETPCKFVWPVMWLFCNVFSAGFWFLKQMGSGQRAESLRTTQLQLLSCPPNCKVRPSENTSEKCHMLEIPPVLSSVYWLQGPD